MTDKGLGGGNHFLSLEASDDYLYIIVHTGSRNLGIYMYQRNYRLLQQHNPGHDWLPLELATPDYLQEYGRVLAYAASCRQEFVYKTYDFLLRNRYVGAGRSFPMRGLGFGSRQGAYSVHILVLLAFVGFIIHVTLAAPTGLTRIPAGLYIGLAIVLAMIAACVAAQWVSWNRPHTL